jgi:hypothetical protein
MPGATQPRRQGPYGVAYKTDEGTLQRLSNITNNPKNILPLTTTSATTMSWNPFAVCGIPHGGPVSCCGVTKKGEPCKNSVKVQEKDRPSKADHSRQRAV